MKRRISHDLLITQHGQPNPTILCLRLHSATRSRDRRRPDLQRALGGFFLLPLIDFFHESVDHLVFEDVADDFAAFEDDAFAFASGDTEVGFAGFAGAVDNATEHADLDGSLAAGHALAEVRHQRFQVDLDAAARRAGDQLGLAHAPLRRLQDVEGGGDFDGFRGEQADADGVADAVEQDRAEAARRLDRSVRRLARFGNADVRRVIALLGVQAVRFDAGEHIAGFERNDDVAIAFRLGDLDVAQCAFDHGRRAREARLFDQLAFEAAGVDADPHRHTLGLGLANDLAIAVVAADVARIDANLVDGMIERGQRHLVIEVDVADQRHVNAALDLA